MKYREQIEEVLGLYFITTDAIDLTPLADKIVALRDDENKQRNTKIIELEEMVVDMHKEIYKLEGAKNE